MVFIKRFFSILCVALLFLATSCNNGNSELKDFVKAFNKRCPIPAGEYGEITGARLDGDNVIISMVINEGFLNLEAISNNDIMLKTNAMQILSNPTDDVQTMIDFMIENAGSITYEYLGNNSDRKVSVTVTNNELKSIGEDDADPDAALDAQIALTNIQFPKQVDEVTIAVKISRENGDVVYWYEIDEQQYNMSLLDQYRDVFQNNLLNSLRTKRDDITLKVFLNTCRKANADIIYRCQGKSSGQSYDFKVSIADVFSN